MNTTINMTISLISGETISIAFGKVEVFQFMKEGFLFIQEPDEVTDEGPGRLVLKKKVKWNRLWIPYHQIKKVGVTTLNELQGEEIKKYDVFKKHGIDITKTKVSHTEPLTPAEIEQVILEAQKKKEAAKSQPEKPGEVQS